MADFCEHSIDGYGATWSCGRAPDHDMPHQCKGYGHPADNKSYTIEWITPERRER